MARDIKLTQDPKTTNWDINFSNGDFELTDGLDTALFLSVLAERRASNAEVENPILRRGHFSNIFSDVEDYQVGSLLWFYLQNKNTEDNLLLMNSSINLGLEWMVEDDIISRSEVSIERSFGGVIILITVVSKDQQETKYFNAFVATFI